MHLILTGATGLVGSAALDAMIRAKDISKISIISRRPVPMADDAKDPRINVIIHKDFNNFDSAILDQLKDAHGCVWALGISQTKVSKEDYVSITKDYTLAAAESFSKLATAEKPFRFVYVSGEGASQTPGRFSPIFARVKGETETALSEMMNKYPSLRADSVRPAFVDNAKHEAIKPYVPDAGFIYNAAKGVLGPVMRSIAARHSPTEELGDYLTQLAMGKQDAGLASSGAFQLGSSWIVPNVAFRKAMSL